MTLKVQPTDLTEMYAFWIGYYDTYSYSNWFINNDYWDNLYVYLNAFQWLDGSMTDYTNWGLTKNGNMEPDYHFMAYTPLQANRSCTVLLADYKGKIDYWNAIKTQWFDDNYGCSSKYSGTICQKDSKIVLNITINDDIEYFCDDGWTLYGVKDALNHTKNMCYQYIYQQNMDYFDAKQHCDSMNSSMVYIENQYETNFLLSLARSLLSPNSTTPIPSFYAFWISFIEFNRTFEWNWLDGSPVDYVKWARYMPKMLFDLIPLIDYQTPSCTILVAKSEPIPFRSCCYYLYQDLTSFWVDVEKNSSVSSAISNNNEGSISSVSNLQCDDGWTQYELKNVLGERYNMCYSVIYNETKITSDEGLNYCSSVNASLTVLENQDELKFIKEKLIIRSNTRASFSFWINPIADACGFHKPEWNITWPEKNGIDVDWDGYNTMYSSCCDSTFYWANTSLTSEYFPFKFYEPYFHLNKSCIAISVDGDNDFEVPRNGGIFAEYCDYPHIGAICKKKPDKPIKPVQKLINMQSNPSTTQTIIDNSGFTTNYSATYKSTLSPKCETYDQG
uniref:C-type lectin domain-containing protein n=1 Tax=Acrobeloides nanus TaxID=290746 RepID=A0A914DY74_9BILA